MTQVLPHPSYEKLSIRVNQFPQGAPSSECLTRIYEHLFSKEDAELISMLPIKPFTLKMAANIWKRTEAESQKLLDNLTERGLMLDIEGEGKTVYAFPPPMTGFFEFSMMRERSSLNQRALSSLFQEYTNVEGDFIKALYLQGSTPYARAILQEPAINETISGNILDYDTAGGIIESASHLAVGLCYCRHKNRHLELACDAPLETCMMFNIPAASMAKHGTARRIDKKEAADIIQRAYEHHLVQIAENVRDNINFICNCCSDCCEVMGTAKRYSLQHPLQTTSFIPVIENESCIGCGKCAQACPIGAIDMVSESDPELQRKQFARLHQDVCLGCGHCAQYCASQAIHMTSRPKRVVTPYDTAHRVVMMAIERGKLQDLLFDMKVLASHRILSNILGAILKLPPLERALASDQVKSRFFDFIFSHGIVQLYPKPVTRV